MVERGQHLRLALEACEAIGIERERVGDDLQRDVATELRIARAIDLAHPARAEGGDDLIRAEARYRHLGAFVGIGWADSIGISQLQRLNPRLAGWTCR